MHEQSQGWSRREWEEAVSAPDLAEELNRRGIALRFEGPWTVLLAELPASGRNPLSDLIGEPGLWRWRAEEGHPHQLHRRIFEIPPCTLLDCDGQADGEPAACIPGVREMLAWALETLEASEPGRWQTPQLGELEQLIPKSGLTVRSGPHARQGELISAEGCLAIRFPILTRLPESMTARRRLWLRRLLLDARNRWRLVRLGLAGDGDGSPILAEVNLTGAPLAALPGLVRTSSAALRVVMEWVLTPAAFLADVSINCRALEDCAPATKSS